MRSIRVLLATMMALCCTTAFAQGELTGNFRMSATTLEVFSPADAESISHFIALDEEVQWQVFVPETYDSSRPPGVFIFVDPNGWGGMPDQYRQLFTSRNMIWIGARGGERNPETARKMFKAVMAERIIDKNYTVDLNRLYVGGAGNESVTVLNLMLRASEFNGALYINGSANWGADKPDTFDYLARKPHAFIIGSGDKKWQAVRADYDRYKAGGVENVKLLYRSGTIRDWPDAEQMDEALAFLDAH